MLGGEALKEPFTALHEILVQVRGSHVSSPAVKIRGPVLCVLACRAIYSGVLALGYAASVLPSLCRGLFTLDKAAPFAPLSSCACLRKSFLGSR